MNNIYTDEFIKLAALIQDEIEPEPLTFFIDMNYPEDGILVIGHICAKGWLPKDEHVDTYCPSAEHYTKESNTLLPSLSWLVRKISDATLASGVAFHEIPNGWVCREETHFSEPDWKEDANSPELAALKAYCKIKGLI